LDLFRIWDLGFRASAAEQRR